MHARGKRTERCEDSVHVRHGPSGQHANDDVTDDQGRTERFAMGKGWPGRKIAHVQIVQATRSWVVLGVDSPISNPWGSESCHA